MKRKVFSDDLLLYLFVVTQHPLPVKTDVIGHINLYLPSKKISDAPFISKGRLKSETGNAAGLKLFFCVQKTKFSSSLRFASCLIG
ncbi:hypothetical protein HMPREF2936_00400 [Neisseria sp. HMSC064F04]|uniref:hypothetical protein n=1 Tax=Neisseria mucosa TaxID=488 RepID=UPI0008A87F0D|nr:hypothetical protein [Neisseria mucosa]OHR42763.1 hypothetical protein HMPREF2936_00400 [Neisseria sp. HMSC064F04]